MEQNNKNCPDRKTNVKNCGCRKCLMCEYNERCKSMLVSVNYEYTDCETIGEAYDALRRYIADEHVIASVDPLGESGRLRVTGHFGAGFQAVENERHYFSFFCDERSFCEKYSFCDFVQDLRDVGILN